MKEDIFMKSLAAVSLLSLIAPVAWTQQPPGEDPIAQNLFPPELVMKHQHEIGLDEAQGKAIKDAIQKAQSRFLDVQWEMQSESGKLIRLLQADRKSTRLNSSHIQKSRMPSSA